MKKTNFGSVAPSTSSSKTGSVQEKIMTSIGIGSAAGISKLMAGLLAYPHEVRHVYLGRNSIQRLISIFVRL